MKNRGVALFQLLTYLLFALPVRWLWRVKRSGDYEGWKSGCSYIIASNHPSRMDPFLVMYSFPLKLFVRAIPVRFVTAPEYLTGWWAKLMLIPFGCVSTMPRNEKGLAVLKRLLSRGETIYFFPSGCIEEPGMFVMPKVGVVYLEREVLNAMIVPIKIIVEGRRGWGEMGKGGGSVHIQFKIPFRHASFNKDLEPLAKDVMRRIMGPNG